MSRSMGVATCALALAAQVAWATETDQFMAWTVELADSADALDTYVNEELQAVYDFINNGGNAVFFSGNNIWWQIRYEQNGRQMLIHKDPRSWPAPSRKR